LPLSSKRISNFLTLQAMLFPHILALEKLSLFDGFLKNDKILYRNNLMRLLMFLVSKTKSLLFKKRLVPIRFYLGQFLLL
jgi:hypothetical protein